MKLSIYKRIASLIMAMIVCFALLPSFAVTPVAALSQNQQNIVDRADYLYGITWTAQKSISAHAYSSYYTFYAGNTYHLPYGQGPTAHYIGYGVTPENFISAAANPNSIFYSSKSYAGSWYSAYYITDCSGFVSWCWGIGAKQSTRTLADYSTYVASISTYNIRNYLQVGDALNRYDYHVVLVTDMIYDSNGTLTAIEITEQTIPQTKRTLYSPSQLASAYANYDGIYRYNGTVPESPGGSSVKEETWIEKACFDVMVYRDRNPDLADYTDAELKEHWLNYGIKEGRASSPILDLGFYLNNNPDLQEAFGTDYEKVYNHFITSGYKEYRKSSALFDGGYYCNKYPDVAENYKEQYLLHYMDHGIKEGRRGSLTFDPDYYWYIRPDVYEVWPGDYEMCAKHYAGHGINAQIEAYDNKQPVISNVTVSDISATGYTVSCTVTDNWGISKVAFPAWTLQNDQDDLPENFMNTQLGTKDGDTYTFRVNTADHNNESGLYITHIYAFDKGGNRVQYVLDTVDVKEQKITLNSTATYERADTLLQQVKPSTTVDALLSQFTNDNLTVLDKDGNAISGTALVGTGAQIRLCAGTDVLDAVTVVILGDVDGNGKVDTTDYLKTRSAYFGSLVLNETETAAADINKSGSIDTSDYTTIRDYFLRNAEL